jgi:hypothetical protein
MIAQLGSGRAVEIGVPPFATHPVKTLFSELANPSDDVNGPGVRDLPQSSGRAVLRQCDVLCLNRVTVVKVDIRWIRIG